VGGEVEAYASVVPLVEELKGTEYQRVAEAPETIIKEEDEHMNMGVVGLERCGTAESLREAKEFILKRSNTAWGDFIQFVSVAGRTLELARQAGLGRELPTDWFLQDIRN
jgi:hypothetical protein